MPRFAPLSRSLLLTLSLLSACAAGGVAGGSTTPSASHAYGAFLQARFADSQFDLAKAAHYYRAAAAADPTNPVLHEHAFITSLMAGSPVAKSLVAGAEPDDQVASLLRIGEAARAGQWNGAIAAIKALPDAGVTQVLQPLLLAWAEQGAGRTDAALAVLKPHLSGPEARGVDVLHAAMIADLAGRDATAGQYYALAAKDFSGPNLRLARVLASWQARQGEKAKAEATLAALADHNNDLAMILPDLERHMTGRPVASAQEGMAETYLAVAASLSQQDAAGLTVVMLRLALELRPDLAPARLLLANTFDAQGQPAVALKVLAPVGKADPLAGLVGLRRASLLDEVGKTDEALDLLDRLAQRYRTRPEPLEVKGDLLRAHARWGAAITAYDGAIARLTPPKAADWSLFYDRGIAYDQVHDWPRAQADFETALKLKPDQPYVLNYLGYSWAVRGQNLDQARRMIAEAAKLRPDDGAILDSLGYVMLRQGDTSGALHWLLKAVSREPDDPTINGHLGDAYWAAGDRLAARYQWQLALSMHPDAKEAARLHAKLGADEGSEVEGAAAEASRAGPQGR